MLAIPRRARRFVVSTGVGGCSDSCAHGPLADIRSVPVTVPRLHARSHRKTAYTDDTPRTEKSPEYSSPAGRTSGLYEERLNRHRRECRLGAPG